nr:hypothetical protein [Corynebacterium guaraldiae]
MPRGETEDQLIVICGLGGKGHHDARVGVLLGGAEEGFGVGVEDIVRVRIGRGNRLHGVGRCVAIEGVEHVARGVEALEHRGLRVTEARGAQRGEAFLDFDGVLGAQFHVAHEVDRAGAVDGIHARDLRGVRGRRSFDAGSEGIKKWAQARQGISFGVKVHPHCAATC